MIKRVCVGGGGGQVIYNQICVGHYIVILISRLLENGVLEHAEVVIAGLFIQISEQRIHRFCVSASVEIETGN
jgi:hypothetical protein